MLLSFMNLIFRGKNINYLYLNHSKSLEASSSGHSEDMARYDFFSHKSKVRSKRTLKERLQEVEIYNASSAENIAKTFSIRMISGKSFYTPSQNGGYFSYDFKGNPIPNHTYLSFAMDLVDQWMNSPGHRENILNPEYIYLGCGTILYPAKNSDEVSYIISTQNFSSKDSN